MITEDYVSFEVAKLLKDKGFNEYCKSVYHIGSVCSVASLGYHDNEGCGAVIDGKQNSDFGKYDNAISAPTLQMVMKWLREVFNLFISIQIHTDGSYIWYVYNTIYDTCKGTDADKESDSLQHSYEEACETAIKYCLENLI